MDCLQCIMIERGHTPGGGLSFTPFFRHHCVGKIPGLSLWQRKACPPLSFCASSLVSSIRTRKNWSLNTCHTHTQVNEYSSHSYENKGTGLKLLFLFLCSVTESMFMYTLPLKSNHTWPVFLNQHYQVVIDRTQNEKENEAPQARKGRGLVRLSGNK